MCSYCGCENIEVVGRFMREHTEIINASGVLRAACDAGSQDAIAAAAAEVARLFAPHSAAEEAGIFTVMAEDPEFTDYVTRLCSEHEQLNAHLATIVAAADDANRHAAYEEFEHLLRGHIDREDNSPSRPPQSPSPAPSGNASRPLTPDA